MSELDLTDASLVARCINRDRWAWHKFVERFSNLVFWAIKNKLKQSRYFYNQQDIEDIFQNVFISLWEKEKLRQVINRKDISAWLVILAVNCTYNYFRNKREVLFDKEVTPEDKNAAPSKMDVTVKQGTLSILLEETITSLPAREQIILKLNYLYDKTHLQISQILKIPANTVSSVIKRTKETLQKKLKGNNREDGRQY